MVKVFTIFREFYQDRLQELAPVTVLALVGRAIP